MAGGKAERDSNGAFRAYGTVVFSDLCGSTELGGRVEPEELANIVLEVKRVLEATIVQHGGTVVQFQGDGVLAVFGYPRASENAPRDALAAALAAHEKTRQTLGKGTLNSALRIRLHTGVHSGVFLARPGNQIDGRYAMFGDTVNIAAHLCAAAGTDEILASDTTIGGLGTLFEVRSVAPIKLKGKRDLFPVSSILGGLDSSNESAARRAISKTPFVGRSREMAQLKKARHEAESGSMRAVSLLGEPGIGKTRLASEFIDILRESGALCSQGYCENFGACGPLQPISHILFDLLDVTPSMVTEQSGEVITARLLSLDAELLEHSGVLRNIMGVNHKAAVERLSLTAVVDALAKLFLVLSKRSLLVVSFDDWQWADDASRHVLSELLDRNLPEKILFILTARQQSPDDPVLVHADSVPVDALSITDSADALGKVTSIVPDGSLMERIYEYSGGNPLYLEEILHHLAAGSFDVLNQDSELSTTATLPSLIEARISRFSPDDRRLVQSASVLGNVVDIDLLSKSANDGTAVLERDLLSTGLFNPGRSEGIVQFKHGITREVIYHGMDLGKRRECHSAAAAIIEDQTDESRKRQNSEILAYHYAGAGQPGDALRCAEAAAVKALNASSLDRARLHFVACVQALDNLEDTPASRRRFVDICDKLSVSCVYGPSQEHLRILERAADYAVEMGDVGALARISRWSGYINYVFGAQDKAISHFEKALAGASATNDPNFDFQVKANLGQAYAAACDYEPALTYLDEALERGHQSIIGSKSIAIVAAYAMSARALVIADLGRFKDAFDDIDFALNDYGGASHVVEASIRNISCTAHIWRGDLDFVLEEAQRARLLAERSGATYVLACSLGIQGYAQCKSGDRSQGISNLRQAGALFERRGLRLFSSLYHGWLADGLLDIGDHAGAEKHARKALDRVAARDLFGEAPAYRVLASIAVSRPDPNIEDALQYLKLAKKSAEARQSPHEMAATELREAEILAKCGRMANAVAPLNRARSAFSEMDMHWHDTSASALSTRL